MIESVGACCPSLLTCSAHTSAADVSANSDTSPGLTPVPWLCCCCASGPILAPVIGSRWTCSGLGAIWTGLVTDADPAGRAADDFDGLFATGESDRRVRSSSPKDADARRRGRGSGGDDVAASRTGSSRVLESIAIDEACICA